MLLRQRRIKCDETRPSCLRCLRINEVCPGFQLPLARIFGLATFEGFNNDFEKLCFDSFLNGGSSKLALFQPSTRSFWTTILPQLSQVCLPLRHATIALAYVNEPFFNPQLTAAARARGTIDTLHVVLTHFNASLRGFVQNMERLSIEAKLSCCIVFTALTIYMSRVGGVSSHASAAFDILRQYENANGLDNLALKQVFAPCVQRLLIDACTFSGGMNNVGLGGYNPFERHMYEILVVPPTIDTVEDAYEILGNSLKYAIFLFTSSPVHHSRIAAHLQTTLQRYQTILAESRLTEFDGETLPSTVVEFHRKDLSLHHRMAQLIASLSLQMLEVSYSTFTPQFRAILGEMKDLIASEPKRSVRITLGWMPPLFLVATKCRAPNVRSQALRMIHDLNRVERGWTSCVAYNLAKFVIDLETKPQSRQDFSTATHFDYVRLMSVRFDREAQTARVRYLLQRDRQQLGMFSANLYMKGLSQTLTGAPAINVADPVLQAFGYSGVVFFSPDIKCHCHLHERPVRHTGRVAPSSEEKAVVWHAGRSKLKTVQPTDKWWFQTIAGTKTQDEQDNYVFL